MTQTLCAHINKRKMNFLKNMEKSQKKEANRNPGNKNFP
jgi:hypothetical protein